jgi:CDP-diacylglycerol--serine O-phosphatidyltransferase
MFNLPNLLTLINLFSGCVALVFVFSFKLTLVPYAIAISLIADFFDGMAARAFKTPPDFGKQIDSLADVVTFGVVPASVVFQLLYQYWETKGFNELELLMLSTPAFSLALFAALRLAKFNIDNRQTQGFIGLATPAATIFVIGILLVFLTNSFGLAEFIFKPFFLYAMVAILCILMVAEIPMFSFKINFKNGVKGNEVQIVFIVLTILLAATIKFAAVPASIILYVLLSIIQPIIKK